ncbi:hypothetical protein DDW10_00195 [Sulfolobales archaeon SCGC AB-777_J03]|nr:hypothetical protein DDW10_00195 [Sulfolobales archaeon SCGC AB-777_J03]
MKLIDSLGIDEITEIEKYIREREKGGIKREASLHRWWSRRSIFLYRAILTSFILRESDLDRFYDGVNNPYTLNANGLVFLEPMAGGGTGLVEASMYNYNAYGIDINPLAVKIIEGYSTLKKEITWNKIYHILNETDLELNWLWHHDGKLVSYILITRGKIPSWIFTRKKKKVILCPYCGNVFETTNDNTVSCPKCGHNIDVTIKPVYEPPFFSKYFKDWKIFGIIHDDRSFSFDEKWITQRVERLGDFDLNLVNVNLLEIKEGIRLIKSGISKIEEVFTPAQLYTYYVLSTKAKELNHEEKTLLMLASSDSVKTCSVLSKWYPPLTEPVIYAGGVKGFWVPEYTAETNPIASYNKKPKARGNIISGIKNQEKIIKKFKFRGEILAIYGDAREVEYPKSDLIVIDPPYYGFDLDYASLSLPHYAIANMFEKLGSLNRAIEKEIKRYDFFSSLRTILEKSKNSLRSPEGRIVLIINFNNYKDWEKLYSIIEDIRLNVINSFKVRGESPGKLGRSENRDNKIIILAK